MTCPLACWLARSRARMVHRQPSLWCTRSFACNSDARSILLLECAHLCAGSPSLCALRHSCSRRSPSWPSLDAFCPSSVCDCLASFRLSCRLSPALTDEVWPLVRRWQWLSLLATLLRTSRSLAARLAAALTRDFRDAHPLLTRSCYSRPSAARSLYIAQLSALSRYADLWPATLSPLLTCMG